ncbi:MAG: glyoxalase/bleomycin resistance/extradiol dioxygenase family protein [Rhodobacteraceae bacterium]|nr:MAG: glyoxalase/bleomycin resistance/extradiol dioxygenase family protein [Paracoccaceae bacterium]
MISGVLEAAVYAEDLEAARGFYAGVLDLPEISAVAGRHVFFRCGASVLLVFCASASRQPPGPGALPVPPHGAEGAGHVCLRVAKEDLDTLATRLENAGVAIESDFRWPHGPRSIYVRDPAGNSVEFADGELWGLAG